MKKIETKEQKAGKEKRNQLIVGMILIVLMILSTLGYALSGRDDEKKIKVDYKGVNFLKENDYWSFSYEGYNFITRYYPEELKDIKVSNKLLLVNYAGKTLYFVTNTGQPEIETARNLNSVTLRIQGACLSKENCTGNYPIKDCSQDNIIIFKEPYENENERVYQTEKCVFIIANDLNQIKYADAFLFSVLGLSP